MPAAPTHQQRRFAGGFPVTPRVAIEQASAFGWDRWVGSTGTIIAMSTFGASAPSKSLQTKFGFTPEAVVAAARQQIRTRG